eukprot:TRINITY_DN20065_c0_g1_i1.p1 TRINITY_DN20065_c0_g1~~TRINITY_DN20065_c0_g1_i1.p1  ORF type:complete len:681 (+),score=178.14 TRINITY_DN20065_c0_g1_i1:74-2044(+)
MAVQALLDEGYAAAVAGDHVRSESLYRAAAEAMPTVAAVRASWAEELSALGDVPGALRQLRKSLQLGQPIDVAAVEAEEAFAPVLSSEGWAALKRDSAEKEDHQGLCQAALDALLRPNLTVTADGEVLLSRACSEGGPLLRSDPVLVVPRWRQRHRRCSACAALLPSGPPYPSSLYSRRREACPVCQWRVCGRCRLRRRNQHSTGGDLCGANRALARLCSKAEDRDATLASLAVAYAVAASERPHLRRWMWTLRGSRDAEVSGSASSAAMLAAAALTDAGVDCPTLPELAAVATVQLELPHTEDAGSVCLPGPIALVPCATDADFSTASKGLSVGLKALRTLPAGAAVRTPAVTDCDCGACGRLCARRGGRLWLTRRLPGCPEGDAVPWTVPPDHPSAHQAAAVSLLTNGFAVIPQGVPTGAAVTCGEAGLSAVQELLRGFAEQTGSDALKTQLRFNELCDRSPLRFDVLHTATSSPEEWQEIRQHKSQAVSGVLTAVGNLTGERSRVGYTELASGCVVSVPGCPPQAWHHDGKPPQTDLYVNSFVALCDTPAQLGPTELVPWPRKWCPRCQMPHLTDSDSSVVVPELAAGSIMLTSYRCYHRGGANRGDKWRPLAYYAHAPGSHPGVRGSGTFPLDRPIRDAASLGPYLPFPEMG